MFGMLDEKVNKTKAENEKTYEDPRLKDSIERARKCGVPEDLIIHNELEGMKFFMS